MGQESMGVGHLISEAYTMSFTPQMSHAPTQTKSVRITFLTRGDKRVEQQAGGCEDKRAASLIIQSDGDILVSVLSLIKTHASNGLVGLTPSVTTQQHSRFKTGRW